MRPDPATVAAARAEQARRRRRRLVYGFACAAFALTPVGVLARWVTDGPTTAFPEPDPATAQILATVDGDIDLTVVDLVAAAGVEPSVSRLHASFDADTCADETVRDEVFDVEAGDFDDVVTGADVPGDLGGAPNELRAPNDGRFVDGESFWRTGGGAWMHDPLGWVSTPRNSVLATAVLTEASYPRLALCPAIDGLARLSGGISSLADAAVSTPADDAVADRDAAEGVERHIVTIAPERYAAAVRHITHLWLTDKMGFAGQGARRMLDQADASYSALLERVRVELVTDDGELARIEIRNISGGNLAGVWTFEPGDHEPVPEPTERVSVDRPGFVCRWLGRGCGSGDDIEPAS